MVCSTPRLSHFPRKLGVCALGGDPGMEAGGRLFQNLSSACPCVPHHEVLWAAGSSSFGSCQGPPGPGRHRAPAPHQTRQAQAKENLEVRRRLASCNGGPGGCYPCRSERGAPQLSLQLEELLSGADPALDSAGKPGKKGFGSVRAHAGPSFLVHRLEVVAPGGLRAQPAWNGGSYLSCSSTAPSWTCRGAWTGCWQAPSPPCWRSGS